MSPITREIIDMIDMLPETDQQLVYALVKKMVLAWDADFTKLTASERKRLELTETEEYTNSKDINWDN